MAERPAVNASPLILLARANLLDLLQLAGPDTVVPAPVADEILREGPQDPAARALETVPWLTIVEAPPVPAVVQAWDLGAGESSVLAWASTPGSPWGKPGYFVRTTWVTWSVEACSVHL